jgi:acetylornithine deacetylase/succinyl-diaminopimelate desuccinylase-like protein
MTIPATDNSTRVVDDAVAITRRLIQFDTTNTGEPETTKGERQASEYVVGLLQDVGLEPTLVESEPTRASLWVRLEGRDSTRPALVAHGHLDVVPAQGGQWRHDPFGGELIDGVIWGRGAVDMKDMDGMLLANVRDWARRGVKPDRDIILAFFADEEAGGRKGAHWVVEHYPEVFHGATEAVSEVGGYSAWVNGRRVFFIQTAEKAIAWAKLTARGQGGHGMLLDDDNAVAKLVAGLDRLANHTWPKRLTPTMRELVRVIGDVTGQTVDLDSPDALDQVLAALGSVGRFVGASAQTTANLTGLQAGVKVNMIPEVATALVDARPMPGERELTWQVMAQLLGPDIEIERVNDDVSVESPIDTPLVQAMHRSLLAKAPDAVITPYMLAGGTDNKAMATLGIHGYGFVPLDLPPTFDFPAMFHGIDERVPVTAMGFGTSVLGDFLAHC